MSDSLTCADVNENIFTFKSFLIARMQKLHFRFHLRVDIYCL